MREFQLADDEDAKLGSSYFSTLRTVSYRGLEDLDFTIASANLASRRNQRWSDNGIKIRSRIESGKQT